MRRVVLDINVIVSGTPDRGTPPSQIISRWQQGHFALVVSEHILSRAEGVWNRPYFADRLNPDVPQRILSTLRSRGESFTPVDDVHGIADDEEDDLVLATAVAGSADYLVTGDKGLLTLGSFRGVRIVTPRAFLDILEATDTADEK